MSAIIRRQAHRTAIDAELNQELREAEGNPKIALFQQAILHESKRHNVPHAALFKALSFDKPVLELETFLFSCRRRFNIHHKSMSDGDLRDVFSEILK